VNGLAKKMWKSSENMGPSTAGHSVAKVRAAKSA
jgi:hypothetical protein